MLNTAEDFVLRPIHSDDNADKLSLGNVLYIPLKIFLKKNAFDFHQYEIAKTYVLINQSTLPTRIWAYITLMNSEIVLNEGQRPEETPATLRYEAFPAIKIARLAVDKNLQGKGFGIMLMDWCINHVKLAIMPHVGCRFLVVDSKQNSVGFYKKAGFTLLTIDENQNSEYSLMFFDLYKESLSEAAS